jgi:hypothetical protein
MKVILGGGLISLLARDILGDSWTIVPIGRSRFYSFNPALIDNFIVKDEVTDKYMQQHAVIPYLHRVGYSYGGQLLFSTNLALAPYLEKVYGGKVPPHARPYYENRIDFWTSGNCVDIYSSLQAKYKDEILGNAEKYGTPQNINNHVITTDKGKFEYERMISTVPLDVLLKWTDISWVDLPSRDLYFYHVRTSDLDFEGATQLLVVDPETEFHKAIMLNRLNYVFQSCAQIEYPGQYFMGFMKNFELVAETMIERAISCGPTPKIDELDTADIMCLGSSAWDDCLDVGSSIKRLLKFGER